MLLLVACAERTSADARHFLSLHVMLSLPKGLHVGTWTPVSTKPATTAQTDLSTKGTDLWEPIAYPGWRLAQMLDWDVSVTDRPVSICGTEKPPVGGEDVCNV